jgi:hypothetical protein
MNNYSRQILFAFLVGVLAITALPVTAQDKPSANNAALAAASDVGKAVQESLMKANSVGLGGLRLKKAVLTLETGSEIEGGVKLNFIIFTISHGQKKGRTITSTLTFGEIDRLYAAGQPNLGNLTESLARAIAMAAAAATEVKTLPLDEATLKVEFVVEKKTGGGLSFKILGADISGDINLENISKNSLEVTFAK